MTLHAPVLKSFALRTVREQRWQGEATTLDEAVHLADDAGFGLGQVMLSGHDLSHMDFKELVMPGARLDRVTARQTSFRASDLRGANLCAAGLLNTSFRGADLRGADLEGADLEGADLDWAELSGAVVTPGQLQRASVMALRTDLFTACIWRPGLEGRLRDALEGGTWNGDPAAWYGQKSRRGTQVSGADLNADVPRLPRLGERVVRGRLQVRWPRIGRIQAWLSGVRPGTPVSDPVVATALVWLAEWEARKDGSARARDRRHT